MRISDWSSDVCSSDLGLAPLGARPLSLRWTRPKEEEHGEPDPGADPCAVPGQLHGRHRRLGRTRRSHGDLRAHGRHEPDSGAAVRQGRSEESRVGKEWCGTCRSQWMEIHTKTKSKK